MEMENKMEIGKQMCGVEVDGGKWRQEGNGNGEQDGDWKVDVWSGGKNRDIEIQWEEDGGVDGDADRERVRGGKGWEVERDRHGEGY